jgi:hypothetical protein
VTGSEPASSGAGVTLGSGSARPVVLYERRGKRTPPLTRSEHEALVKSVGPFRKEVLADSSGYGWRDLVIPTVKGGGLVVVHRIEHLGKAVHRHVRLRALVDAGAQLHVHVGLPFPTESPKDLLNLASLFEEASVSAVQDHLDWRGKRVRMGQEAALRRGRRLGRRRLCVCGHPAHRGIYELGVRPGETRRRRVRMENVHTDGSGPCLECAKTGVGCARYTPTADDPKVWRRPSRFASSTWPRA